LTFQQLGVRYESFETQFSFAWFSLIVSCIGNGLAGPRGHSGSLQRCFREGRQKQQGSRSNKGTIPNLAVKNRGEGDSSTRNSWVGFDVSRVTGEPVAKAELRMYLGRLSAAATSHTVFGGTSNWQETEITYVSPSNPEVFPFPLDQKDLTGRDVDSWIVYDVTDYVNALVASGQTDITFVVEADDRAYSHYSSRESDNAPQLTLTVGNGEAPQQQQPQQRAQEVTVAEVERPAEPGAFDEPAANETAADGIFVDDVESLQRALNQAGAGDVILVAPGRYAPTKSLGERYANGNRNAYFRANASGSADAPITLKAADPSNPPVLRGLRNSNSDYILWIRGDYWRIENLVLERGGKGLMLDESSNSVVSGVEVDNMGDEGIHLRSGTSNTLIENCIVTQCGKNQPGFGEGIYVGSDGGQWDRFDENCHDNIIRGCEIRNTTAECIDVKEGTKNTIIENCAFYGAKISGENFADSFVDLKGVGAHVRNNRFHKQRNETVTRGVAIVYRRRGPTAERNWIYDNRFYLNNTNGLMVHAYRGDENYTWNNERFPAGPEYQGNAPELYFEPNF